MAENIDLLVDLSIYKGMETILANYPPYVPQINKKTTIVYGEPIYFDEMVQQLKSEKKTPVSF